MIKGDTMGNEIDKLKKKLKKVMQEKDRCMICLNLTAGKKHQLYRDKYRILNEEYWILQESLNYYEGILIAENDEIEIKRIGDSVENMYHIYLKGKAIKIGHIDYEGYHSSIITGDIGYVIDCNYNGHHYAYKALCLLSDYLYKNGIPDFYISVFSHNIPSIKTINRYGGEVIRTEGRLTTYQCNTRLLNIEKSL